MCQLVSFKGNSPGIQHSGSSWAGLHSPHPAPHVPAGSHRACTLPAFPQYPNARGAPSSNYPTAWQPPLIQRQARLHRSSPPASPGSSAIKEQRGQTGAVAGAGVETVSNPVAQIHIYTCTSRLREHSQTPRFCSSARSPSSNSVSIHLRGFSISPTRVFRSHLPNRFSFGTAYCCFGLLVASWNRGDYYAYVTFQAFSPWMSGIQGSRIPFS